jgi:hypothetical protein
MTRFVPTELHAALTGSARSFHILAIDTLSRSLYFPSRLINQLVNYEEKL